MREEARRVGWKSEGKEGMHHPSVLVVEEK
jgi:hypothetical protein